MLDAFLISNRDAIIARTQARSTEREASTMSAGEQLTHGIPAFLDQLVDALRRAKSTDVIDHAQLTATAGRHGEDLLRMGLTIAQVVRDYGDVCQTITELAIEQKALISTEEFRTLNLCLDDATAEAVSVYARQNERDSAEKGNERLGVFAHEMRNLLNTAMLSFESIRSGRVAPGGSTALVHRRALMGLRVLIDRSLADVRLDAGIQTFERIAVAELLEEIAIGALLDAQSRGLLFEMPSVDRAVTIEGDRQSLDAAISNLLQNAFKFSRKNGKIFLMTKVTADRVLFEVEDECGGLPPGKNADLFRAFEQRGIDRTGAGLGLAICRKAAEANHGEIRVRDIPGKGCVFTLDLPRCVAGASPDVPPPASGSNGTPVPRPKVRAV